MEPTNPFSREAFLAADSSPQNVTSIHKPVRRLFKNRMIIGAALLASGAALGFHFRSDRSVYPFPASQNGLPLYNIDATPGATAVQYPQYGGGLPFGKMAYQRYLYSDRLNEPSYFVSHLKSVAPIRDAFLPTLTIRVARQTAVQTVPITFTVPIARVKPAERWDNDAF